MMVPEGYGWWTAGAGVVVLSWGVAAAAVNEFRRRAKRWRNRNRHKLDALPWATLGLALIVAGSWQGAVDARARVDVHPGGVSGFVWVAVAVVLTVVWRVVAASVRDNPDLEYRRRKRRRATADDGGPAGDGDDR